LSFPLAVPKVSAAVYEPGVLPGDWATYGQVSAYWSSANTFYTLPSVLQPLLNVSSIKLLVEAVSGTNLAEARTFTYANRTGRTDSMVGDVATGLGNLTFWTIAGGLLKGDHIYSSSSGPTINDTIWKNFAGVSREVNVLNQTFTVYGLGNGQIASLWDRATGILVEFSFAFTVSNYGSVHGYGSANLTETNLWSATPDFKVNANALILTAGSGSSQNIILTVSSLDKFNGTVQFSLIGQNALPAGPPNPSSVGVNYTSMGEALVTFSVPFSLVEGSYGLSLRASSGALSHLLNFTITVTGDFDISTDVSSLTVQVGGSGIVTVSLNSYGLSGSAGFTAAASAGIFSVVFGQSQITLTPGQSAQSLVTISASNNAVPGIYRVRLTASKGSTSHSIIDTVVVTAKSQSSILGLDPPIFYGILGLTAVLVVAVTIVIRRWRREIVSRDEAGS